jgi:Mrp family chromosome partitioning ATPase
MGRMFRVITEGPIEAVTAGAALAHAHDEPFVHGAAPYIEVGGTSAVFHEPKPQPPLEQTPPPRAKEHLSVSFQGLTPRPTPSLSPIATEVVAYHQPSHTVSGEYRDLAADIRKQVATTGESKAVLFTAASRDRGTTTVLLNLAVTLAKDAKVLVLDADIDRATAARKLGLPDVPGLAEVLNQSTPLAWAIQPTVVPNLQVLAAGSTTGDTPLEHLPRVLAHLRQWFDWILVDGGVWGERPARDTLCSAFDAVYGVIRRSESSAATLRAQLAKHGGLLRGFITTEL